MTLLGVDVSSFQGTIDWPSVAKVASFGIARCVTEANTIDLDYDANIAGMRAAGLVPGAYAFLAGGVGASQAQKLAAKIAGQGILACLDIERPSYHPVPTRADVDAFLGVWKTTGQPLFIYGSRYAQMGALCSSADGPLWLADYGTNTAGSALYVYNIRGGDNAAQWTAGFNGWPGPVLWQYGSKGSVPGIGGAVDLDAFRGTVSDLRAYTLALPDSSTGGDVDPTKEVPVGAVSVLAGATAYYDLASTQVAIPSTAAVASIGAYSTDTRSDGKVMVRVRWNLGGGGTPDNWQALWVGKDKTAAPADPTPYSATDLLTAKRAGYDLAVSGAVPVATATIDFPPRP